MAAANSGAGWWRYVIVFSRFIILFLDSGIEKSFGVLIPTMVERLESDYATIGLICSLPPTVMYLICPLVTLALRRINHRSVAMLGGLLSGLCIFCCAFLKTTVTVGVFLALPGVGLAAAHIPIILALHDLFRENFVFWSTVASYGYTAGSMLLPIVIEESLQAYGYAGAFIILGGVTLHLVVCGATIRKAKVNGDTNQGNSHDKVKKRHKNSSQEWLSPKDEDMFHRLDQECEKEVTKREEIEEEEDEDGNCEETLLQKRLLTQQESRFKRNRETLPNESTILSCGLLKERIFLYALPIPFLISYSTYAWMLFLVPHAEHLGIPPSKAIYLSTLGGIGGVLGRTMFIILIHKDFNDFNMYIVVASICTGSLLLDFISSAYPVRAILAFAQGFTFFIEDSVCSSLYKGAIFDENNFDMAVAICSLSCGLGITCAGVSTGYLFDVTQSFTKVFIINGGIHAVLVINLLIVTVLIKRRVNCA